MAHPTGPATLDQLNRHAISAWLADLAERVDIETVRTRLRGMRRFCRRLAAEGEVDKAPTEGVEMPSRIEKPVRVRTDDELIAATLSDLDLDREIVFVVGKGNRPRAVPYGARTAQVIDRYLRVRSAHPHGARSDRILLGERGPMSTDGVRWRLEVLGAAAGVEGLHPQALRHTFAHRWLASGGQERDLVHLAGWRSDAMLSVYARATAAERAPDAHRRMALGDRL